MLSVIGLELESVSEISSPRWSSVYECKSVECAFTSPVMSASVVSMVSFVVFLGAMYRLAMVMSLKCFVCILRSCISVLSVLMACGVLMCVNVVSDLMYVMNPPPCLCSLSVWMTVKCGICGVLDAEVSFDSCILTMSGCVVRMTCMSSSTVLLMQFALS